MIYVQASFQYRTHITEIYVIYTRNMQNICQYVYRNIYLYICLIKRSSYKPQFRSQNFVIFLGPPGTNYMMQNIECWVSNREKRTRGVNFLKNFWIRLFLDQTLRGTALLETRNSWRRRVQPLINILFRRSRRWAGGCPLVLTSPLRIWMQTTGTIYR